MISNNYAGSSKFFLDTNTSGTILRWILSGFAAINVPVSLSNNTWYHFSVCRVGDDLGLYFNGTQVGHQNLTGYTPDNLGDLGLFNRTDGATPLNSFNGYMDVIEITNSNNFGAAPNAGLTDTITVPTSAIGTGSDMILTSQSFSALSQPNNARPTYVLDVSGDTLTLDSDVKAWASRDNKVTWTQSPLELKSVIYNNIHLVSGVADVTGQPAGTDMVVKITSHNGKKIKVLDGGMQWD
jgi:hypothetical protein